MPKITTETPTVSAKQLENDFGGDVSNAISFAKSAYQGYKEAPNKPFLPHSHTSDQAAEYAIKLASYEKEKKEFNAVKNKVREFNADIDSEIEKYMKEISGLNRIVPADRRDKVWSKAWSDGHSSGYYDVYIQLVELVDLFA